MPLTIPTVEQAEHYIRTVDPREGLVATVMSPSAGSRAAQLHDINAVNRFLVTRTIEDFQAVSLRLDIHYVDFGFLAQWLEEVIGDTELATAVKALHTTQEAFGQLVPRVKAVLQERIEQCLRVLSPETNGEPEVPMAGHAS